MKLLKASAPKELAKHLCECAKFGLDIDAERMTWALRVLGDLE